MDHLACFAPEDLHAAQAPDLQGFHWRLLAQGDSWFSTAQAKLSAHANLLQELVLAKPTAAINCAGQRESLAKLVELASVPEFVELLTGPNAPVWDGILLSVGGNDLIKAAQTPSQLDGQPVPLELRLRGKSTRQSHGTPIFYVDLTVRHSMDMTQTLQATHELDAQRQATGFDQAALDDTARRGFANGAFEDSEEDAGAIVEEFYPTDSVSPADTCQAAPKTSLSEKLESQAQRLSAPSPQNQGHHHETAQTEGQ